MGVCLSRCGDAQQKAGVVAATISHQGSIGNAGDLHDPSHSLKKFLHLYEIVDVRKSSSSPRASLGESLQIPHSSELFSLPDSDAERTSCCISPSPARASRVSASSRTTSSPKSTRNSFSSWGGRFSIDKTVLVGCRKKIRPARGSKSSLASDQDLVAHQRLVEAILRLDRLNDGKNLELRGSSFCSSDLKPKTQVLPKSRSGREPKRVDRADSTPWSRYARHYQLPPHLLKSSVRPKDHCSQPPACDRTDSHCCSSTHDLDPTRNTKVVEEPANVLCPDGFSKRKTMGNLVSLAAPVIKQMPLEKSVTNFLKEVENFVSLIEAPRLSLSSEAVQPTKDDPLIITTVPRSVEESECESTRLPSYRFEETHCDEQFTFFEATFENSSGITRVSVPVATSPQRLPPSASLESHSSERSLPADKPANVSAPESAGKEIQNMSSCSHSQPLTLRVDQSTGKRAEALASELFIPTDPGIEAKQVKDRGAAARAALSEVDPNVMLISKKSPISKKPPSKSKAVKGFNRGISRSLDSIESLVTRVNFDVIINNQITTILPINQKSQTPQKVHDYERSTVYNRRSCQSYLTSTIQ